MKNVLMYTQFIVQATLILVSFNTFLADSGFKYYQIPVVLLILLIPELWSRFLWKVPLIRSLFSIIGFEKYPDINGEWKGILNSSYFYDNKKNIYTKDIDCEMIIRQNPEYIEVDCKFGQSESKSFYAQLIKRHQHSKEWYLIYAYDNQPHDTTLQASPNGGNHKGFCFLQLKENRLEGFYSNDEVRKTRGRINVKKQ